MITYISVFMYTMRGCHPFAAVERGDKNTFYTLTRASAWRLAWACRHTLGRVNINGRGWSWARAA